MKLVWSVMVAVMASSVAGAQSTKPMNGHAMGTDPTMTYTGCVESINHGASLMLTHIAENSMGAMHHDLSMKKDDGMMKKDDGMKKDEQKMDASMDGHAMAPSAFKLTGSSNLKNQVGRKVTVTGTVAKDSMGAMSSDPETLTVRSLKVIAKSCS